MLREDTDATAAAILPKVPRKDGRAHHAQPMCSCSKGEFGSRAAVQGADLTADARWPPALPYLALNQAGWGMPGG
jgi:hypothetical protein